MSDNVEELGIVGAGFMGAGVAQVAAEAGIRVGLHDATEAALSVALDRIRGSLDRRSAAAESTDEIMARITTSADIESLANADLVVEAVFETLEAKREVFARLDRTCRPDTVFGTNTSAIPVTLMATATQRPELVVGTHFFSPVHKSRLCEVVRGELTSDATVDYACTFAQQLGKETVVVNRDLAGFITTKIGAALCIDAIRLFEAGVASPYDIDKAMRLGFGHPMGPFEMMDMTGLDVMLEATTRIYEETGESRYVPPPALARKVAVGHLGRKSGQGWYPAAPAKA